jgi:RimJ/RimL family protein N-acetyltransferase
MSIAYSRLFVESDFALLHEIRNDIELQHQLMVDATPQSEEQTRDWIARRSTSATTFFRVLADDDNDQCVGFVQLIDIANNSGRLGIGIHRSFQGKGYGRSGLISFIDECRRSGIDRIELVVLAANTTARNLYQSIGFVEIPDDSTDVACKMVLLLSESQ